MASFYPTAQSFGNAVRRIFLTLLAVTLVSCAPAVKLPTPTATSSTENLSTPISPTETDAIQATPTLSPASEIIATDKVSSIPLGFGRSVQIGIDDNYIYWVSHQNADTLFRVSKNGGNPEKIAATSYATGRLDFTKPLLTGKWIVFGDTDASANLETWRIRILNLQDRSERVLLDIKNDKQGIINSFNMAVSDGWLIWTLGSPDGSENSIWLLNLDTGEKRELLRTKVNGWIWSLISMSKGSAVVERDADENHTGGGLYLLDLASGKTQVLADANDENSNMPQFNSPWVFWKSGPRYQFATQTVLYNLNDHEKRLLLLHGLEDTDPLMDGSFIFWMGTPSAAGHSYKSIYIYDIFKNTTYLFNPPESQTFNEVAIHGNTIAWVRVKDWLYKDSPCYLEWTTIQ